MERALSSRTQELVNQWLLKLGKTESYVESLRLVSIEVPEFNTFAAFRHLSKGKSHITAEDFADFMSQYNISDGELLAKDWDDTGQGSVRFCDFLKKVRPKSPISFDVQQAYSKPPCKMSKDIEYTLARLLERELIQLQEVKQEVAVIGESFDFNPTEIFNAMNVFGLEAIDEHSLIAYLKINEIKMTESEVKYMIETLNNGSDSDLITLDHLYHYFGKQLDQPSIDLSRSRSADCSSNQPSIRITDIADRLNMITCSRITDKQSNSSLISRSQITEVFEAQKDQLRIPGVLGSPKHKEPRTPLFDQSEAPTAVPSPLSDKYARSHITPKKVIQTPSQLLLAQIFKKYIQIAQSIASARSSCFVDTEELYNNLIEKRQGVGVKSLQRGLKSLGIKSSSETVALLMRRYDENGNGYLSVSEFNKIFSGRSVDQTSTNMTLSLAFCQLLQAEKDCEVVRQSIPKNTDFQELFRLLNLDNEDSVSTEVLEEALASQKVF